MARKKNGAVFGSLSKPVKVPDKKAPMDLEPLTIERTTKRLGGVKRWTVLEVKKHIDFIEGLMVLGASNSTIVSQAARAEGVGAGHGGLGITKSRAYTLIHRIKARWEEEDRDRSLSRRGEAERRTIRQIQNCQGRRAPDGRWIEKPNYSAIIRFEEHLAKLQGTYAPIEVDVNVRHTETLVAVFSRYPIDHLQRLHEKAQLRKRLAAAFLEEHPEEREAIDVEGVAV